MPVNHDKFLDELKVRIRTMTPQTRLYRVLRDGLTERGYWRKLARGNPKAGYAAMKAKAKKVA